MSGITTHVLDTARGRPASGMRVRLHRAHAADGEAIIGEGITDGDGRCADLIANGAPLVAGEYRLDFDTAAWFATTGVESFYPAVSITFTVRDADQHHHVPLLLSPWGYTTYRGS
jgi:5-hydroxyisourate hydrolase